MLKFHALNHNYFFSEDKFHNNYKGVMKLLKIPCVNSYHFIHYMYFYAYQYFCLQKQLQIPEAMEMVQWHLTFLRSLGWERSAEGETVSAPQRGRGIYCKPWQGSETVPLAQSTQGKTGKNRHSSVPNHCKNV